MASDKVDDAIADAERDAEIMQTAIIHGHLAPAELATALSALQRQSLTTVRLLAIVGEDKFITRKEVRPYKAFFFTISGAVLSLVAALILGRLQ